MKIDNIDNADVRLMAQHDGELDGLGEGDREGDDALKLQALEQISEVVRLNHQAELQDALGDSDPFAAMWSTIERRLSANGEAEHAAKAAPAAAAEQRAPADAKELGLLGSISAWLERYRSQMTTGVVCAAAAAALVWFVRPPDKTVEYVEVRSNPTAPAMTQLVSTPAELESLEVYDGSGVVLTIPSEGDEGAATTVIWLSPPDDEESVEGPI